MTVEGGPGQYIDNRKLKTGQVVNEYKNGVIACFIFALTSLLTRELYDQIWPPTFSRLFLQLIVFTVFYETYSTDNAFKQLYLNCRIVAHM